MDPLTNQDLVQNKAALANSDAVEIGPTASAPGTLPPLPSVPAEAFYLDETGHWKAFNPRNYEARTVFSETTMAFTLARQEAGMILLSGPSGSARGGHAFNQGGFDGVAFPATGAMKLYVPDEKAVAAKTVGSASALTTHWQQNVEECQRRFASPSFDAVPRIDEVRKILDVTVTNAHAGLPPPAEVGRMITRFGAPATVTPSLGRALASGTSPALS